MFQKKYGSRAEVMHGIAERTEGDLTKADLKYKDGAIISIRQQAAAKKNPWFKSVAQAKKKLGVKKGGDFDSFLLKGKLLEEARKIHEKKK